MRPCIIVLRHAEGRLKAVHAREPEAQLRVAQEKATLFEAVLDVMRKDYRITDKKPSDSSSRKANREAERRAGPPWVSSKSVADSRSATIRRLRT